MNRRVAIVAGGLALGSAVGLGLAWLPTFGGDENYRYIGFLDNIARAMGVVALGGWLGAYVAAAALWVRDPAPRLPSPGLVATAAWLCGGVATSMGGVLIGQPWGLLFVLFGAWAGVLVASRWELPAWPTRGQRGLHAALVVGLLGGGGLLAARDASDFPAEANPAVRAAWGHTKFGKAYAAAEAYVRAEPAVRKAVGEVKAIAPIPGPNRLSSTPGELLGEFTLGIDGARGHAVAHVTMVHDAQFHLDGTLEGPTGKLALGHATK